jgi:hypothetical protein
MGLMVIISGLGSDKVLAPIIFHGRSQGLPEGLWAVLDIYYLISDRACQYCRENCSPAFPARPAPEPATILSQIKTISESATPSAWRQSTRCPTPRELGYGCYASKSDKFPTYSNHNKIRLVVDYFAVVCAILAGARGGLGQGLHQENSTRLKEKTRDG